MSDTPPSPSRFRGVGARIRSWFLTGLVVAGPLAITIWLVMWFVNTVDQWVKPLIPERYLANSFWLKDVPGLGVVLAFCGLTLLGFLAANFLGRTLIRISESVLSRTPVIRSIYKSVKQLFETVFSQEGQSFRKVGLIEYPMKGSWIIVFLSTPPGVGVKDKLPPGREYTSVFLACTPNPTTGFYIYVPTDEIIELDMTPDDAAKLIMSAGIIQPDSLPRAAARPAA